MSVAESSQIQKIGFERLENFSKGDISLSTLNAGLNYFGVYYPEGKENYVHFAKGSRIWKALNILINSIYPGLFQHFFVRKDRSLIIINSENIDALLKQYGGEEKFLKDVGEGQAVVKKYLEGIRNADLDVKVLYLPSKKDVTIESVKNPFAEESIRICRFAENDPLLKAMIEFNPLIQHTPGQLKPETLGVKIEDPKFIKAYQKSMLESEGINGPLQAAMTNFYSNHINEIDPSKVLGQMIIISNAILNSGMEQNEVNRQYLEISDDLKLEIKDLNWEDQKLFLKLFYFLFNDMEIDLSPVALSVAFNAVKDMIDSINEDPRSEWIRKRVKQAFEKMTSGEKLSSREQKKILAGLDLILDLKGEAQKELKNLAGSEYKREIVLLVALSFANTYDPIALRLLEKVSSRPKIIIDPSLSAGTEIHTQLIDVPTKNYIISIKNVLAGLNLPVTNPKDASLTANDIRLIATAFSREKFRIKTVSLEQKLALAEELKKNKKFEANEKQILTDILGGREIAIWNFQYLPDIAKKVNHKIVKEFLAELYLYPDEKGKWEDAFKAALRNKKVLTKEGALSSKDKTILEKYADTLEKHGEVLLKHTGDEPAIEVLNRIGLSLSVYSPLPKKLDTGSLIVDYISPSGRISSNATKEQFVRFNGQAVDLQMVALKSEYYKKDLEAAKNLTSEIQDLQKEVLELHKQIQDKPRNAKKLKEQRKEKLILLDKKLIELQTHLEKISGPEITLGFWEKYQERAKNIIEANKWSSLLAMDYPFSLPYKIVGWDVIKPIKEGKGTLLFIDETLKRDGGWSNINPQPGDDMQTQVAKMLLIKVMASSQPCQGKKMNAISAFSRIVPGGVTYLISSSALVGDFGEIEVSDKYDHDRYNTFSIVLSQLTSSVNALSGKIEPFNLSMYLKFMTLDESESRFASYLDILSSCRGGVCRMNPSETMEFVMPEDVQKFKNYIENLLKRINNDTYYLGKAIELIAAGQIKGFKIKDGKLILAKEIIIPKSDVKLLDPDHMDDPDLKNLSQLVLDTMPLSEILIVDRASGRSHGYAMQKGMEKNFGEDQNATYTVYTESRPLEQLIPVGDRIPVIDGLKAPLAIYKVPYDIAVLTVNMGVTALRGFIEAIENEDWDEAYKIFFGTPGGSGQDGLLYLMSNFFWAITKFMVDPRVAGDYIEKALTEMWNIGINLGNASELLMWGIWEMFVLYTDYYIIKQAGRFLMGKPSGRMPLPITLRPFVWLIRGGATRLEGLMDKHELGTDWRYEKLGKHWDKFIDMIREKVYSKIPLAKWGRLLRETGHGAKMRLNKRKIISRLFIGAPIEILDRLVYGPLKKFYTLAYSEVLWRYPYKLASLMGRYFRPGYYKTIGGARDYIADDLGLEKGDVSWLAARSAAKKFFGGDHKIPIYDANQSRRAAFLFNSSRNKIKFDSGDIRLRTFEKGLAKVAKYLESSYEVTLKSGEEEALSEQYRIGKLNITEGNAIEVMIYYDKETNEKKIKVEIGDERLRGEIKHQELAKEISSRITSQQFTEISLFDFNEEIEPSPKDKARLEKEVLEVDSRYKELEDRLDGKAKIQTLKEFTILKGELESAIKRKEAAEKSKNKNEAKNIKKEIDTLKIRIQEFESKHDTEAQLREKAIELLKTECKTGSVGEIKYAIKVLNGLILSTSQVESIISGELRISSNKECSGGKTVIVAGINIRKVKNGQKVYATMTHSDYAIRDFEEMRDVHRVFDISVDVYKGQQGKQTWSQVKNAFEADVVYTSLYDLMFLNLQNRSLFFNDRVNIEFDRFLVADEGDYLLLTMSKTPLIISESTGSLVGEIEAGRWYKSARLARKWFRKAEKWAKKGKPNKWWKMTERGIEFTGDGLKKIRKLNDKARARLAKCLQAKLMIKRGEVYYDRVGRKMIIIDPSIDRLTPDNRFEEGLHQGLEAIMKLPIREDTKAVQSDTSLEFLFRFKDAEGMKVVFVSGTMDNPYVKAFCEKLGIKILSQGENVPRIDITESEPEEESKAIDERIAELKEKGDLSPRNGKIPIKFIVDPKNEAQKAAAQRFLGENKGTIEIDGEQFKINESWLEVRNETIFKTRKAKAKAIANKIIDLRSKGSTDPIVVQLFGDAELGEAISKTLKRNGIKNDLLTHKNDSQAKRKATISKAGNSYTVIIGTFNRADNIRTQGGAQKIIAFIAGAGKEGWTTEQAWKRFARDVDSAELFPMYSLDEELFQHDSDKLSELKIGKEGITKGNESYDKAKEALNNGRDIINKRELRQAKETLWTINKFREYYKWFQDVDAKLGEAKSPHDIFKVFFDIHADFVTEKAFENGTLNERILIEKLGKIFGHDKIDLRIEKNPTREKVKAAICQALERYFGTNKFHSSIYGNKLGAFYLQFRMGFNSTHESFRKAVRDLIREHHDVYAQEGSREKITAALEEIVKAHFEGFRQGEAFRYLQVLRRDAKRYYLRYPRLVVDTSRTSQAEIAEVIPVEQRASVTPAPKPVETVLDEYKWTKLIADGVMRENGMLLVYDKSGRITGKKKGFAVVRLNGMSCSENNGKYIFKYNGKEQAFSSREVLEILSNGREILGVNVEVYRGEAKKSRSIRLGTPVSFPALPIESRVTIKAGEIIPPTPPKAVIREIDPKNVQSMEDLIAEIKKVQDEKAHILYESEAKIRVQGRTEDFKAWEESRKVSLDLLFRCFKGDQTKFFEAVDQFKKTGKAEVEIDGKMVELPKELMTDILKGREAVSRILKATIKATAKANPHITPELIKEFLYARADKLFKLASITSRKYLSTDIAQIRFEGTKAQLLQELNSAPYEITLKDGRKIMISIDLEDARKLISDDAKVRSEARKNIIKQVRSATDKLGIGEINEVLKAEPLLKQIRMQMEALKTTFETSQFAEHKLLQVRIEIYKQQMRVLKKKLKGADAMEIEELTKQAMKNIDYATEAYRSAFQAKVNSKLSSEKKTLSTTELTEIWDKTEGEILLKEGTWKARWKYFKKGAPGACAPVKIGTRTVKDGLLGLVVGTVLEGASETYAAIAGDGFNLGRFAENVGTSGLHWARFGAITSANHSLLGWSEAASMYGAMVLPALWDLGNAQYPFEVKGQILVQHAAGLSGFLGGMELGKRTIGARFPRIGGWGTLALGMGGAWVLGKLNASLYQNSEAWRNIVDSEVMNTIGAVLGDSSDYLTAAWAISLGASALGKISVTLTSLDALGTLCGAEATFGGTSAGFSRIASIISRAAGPLVVLAAVKGIFTGLYHVSNNDYEESVAERLGRDLWKRDCDDTKAFCWTVKQIGGTFKFDQKVESYAEDYWTLFQKPREVFEDRIKSYIGQDFSDSLILSKHIALGYSQKALQYLFSEGAATGHAGRDYKHTLGHLKLKVREELSQEVILDDEEKEIYQKVLAYLAKHSEIKGFDDPKLVNYVEDTIPADSPKDGKKILEKISNFMMQHQIKQILLVNPKEMGGELYGLLRFWVDEDPENRSTLYPNPFKGTPIMKMDEVQELHDQFASFFDEKGRLKPGKAQAFAEWLLSRKIGKKNIKNIIHEQHIMRGKQLIATTFAAQRMLELINLQKQGKLIAPTEEDIKLGLVRGVARHIWEVNPQNSYFEAWVKAGKPENVHLVVAQMKSPLDTKLGLVDVNGYLIMADPNMAAAFAPIRQNIIRNASEQKKEIEAQLQKANSKAAKAKKWHNRYLSLKAQLLEAEEEYLALKMQGKSAEALLVAERAKPLFKKWKIAKKKWDKALEGVAEGRAQLNGLKIKVLTLQIQWYKPKTAPFQRALIAAQIEGFGGSTKTLNEKYIAKATKLLKKLQRIDPKKNPTTYVAIIEQILEFMA